MIAVHIAVLSLFHPQQISYKAATAITLEDSSGASHLLAPGDGCTFTRAAEAVIARCGERTLQSASFHAAAGRFRIVISRKFARNYEGELKISERKAELLLVLATDLETAVASVADGELNAAAPAEALRAQAVLARTWYTAMRRRHGDYDFCDTTHCQLYRAAFSKQSLAAAEATARQVLYYKGKPLLGHYSASCGGRTRTAASAGWGSRGYPYFEVECDICQRDAPEWKRVLTAEQAERFRAALHNENGRLALCRRFGWSFLPSRNYTEQESDGIITLIGKGRGHGVGLCQLGAIGMARAGAGMEAILMHYLPRTELRLLPDALD